MRELKLLLIGAILGIGLPFFIAGAVLQATGSKLSIEVVRSR